MKKSTINIRFILIIGISLILFSAFLFVMINIFFTNISIVGDKNLVLNYGEKYSEPGYKATFMNHDISKKVKVSPFKYTNCGVYSISYNYNFLFLNFYKKRKIIVKDLEKPKIVLTSGELLQIYENEQFVDPGFKATDNKDGDITKKVKVIGDVDTSKIGEYILQYKVSDSSKNSTSVERKVTVVKDDRKKNTVNTYNRENVNTNNFDTAIIVGDSNIKNMYLNGYIQKGKAWAIPCLHAGSMKSTALNIYGYGNQMLLLDAVSTYKPEKLILSFGTFSTSWISESEFDTASNEIIRKIRELSPNTQIILISIIPITQNGPNINHFDQNTINYFNTKISNIAINNGLKYIDSQSVLKDQSGYGNPSYFVNDGYHLNSTGHRILKNFINNNM